MADHRGKRFIDTITGIVNLAISGVRLGLDAYKTHKLKTRLRALYNEIKRVDRNSFKLQQAQVKLSQSMNALAIATKNGFREMRSHLALTNQRLDHISDTIQNNILDIMRLGRDSRTLTYTTSIQFEQSLSLSSLYDMSYQLGSVLDKMIAALHTLQLGMLPEELISMSQFTDLLNELADELQVSMPDYEIASTLSSEYFRRKGVIWGVTRNNTLVINLPIVIVEKGVQPYELFSVESYPTPCDIKQINDMGEESLNKAYTQIKLDHKYIAVNKDVYVLLTESNFDECSSLSGVLYCRDLMIHTHKTAHSCLSALYWQADMKEVNEHCEVLYYHTLKPRPQIFENSKSVLLANVENNWRLACNLDSFPRPLNGLSFVLLNIESLCQCQINIGESHFVPRSRTGCSSKRHEFKIRYPVNALMLYNLRDKIGNLSSDFDYYQTRASTFYYNMPFMKVKHMVDDNRVLYDTPADEGVDLEIVTDIIQSGDVALLTANDLVIENSKIGNWWDNNSAENTFMFVSSLLSILCFLLLGCVIMQTCSGKRQISATLASFAAQISKKRIEALEIPPSMTNNTLISELALPQTQPLYERPNEASHVVFEIRFRLALIIVMIISFVGYKLIKYIYQKYFKYRIFVPEMNHAGPSCKLHFYLDVYKDNNSCLVYMRSIKSSFMSLTLDPRTSAKIIGLSKHLFYDYIEVHWSHGRYKIHDRVYEYPTQISVPWFKIWQVRKILSHDPKGRILILDDVMYSLDAINNRIKNNKDEHHKDKTRSNKLNIKRKLSPNLKGYPVTSLKRDVMIELHEWPFPEEDAIYQQPTTNFSTFKKQQTDSHTGKSTHKKVHFDPSLDKLLETNSNSHLTTEL